MPAKLIRTVLEDAAEVRSLTTQSRRLLRLQRLLRMSLPAGIANQFSVCTFSAGKLTVTTNSGAAAAKFRQILPRLLKELRREEPELNAFKVMVQVSPSNNPLPGKQIFLSHTAQSALLTLAAKFTESPLRSAIVRLAKRAESSKNKQETLKEENSYKNQSDKD